MQKKRPLKAKAESKSTQSPDDSARLEAEALARAADALQILYVRFRGFSADSTPRDGDRIPEAIGVRVGFTPPVVYRAPHRVVVTTVFLFKISSKDDEPIVRLRAETEVAYGLTADAHPSDEDLAVFAKLNTPFNAWPYWREMLQSAMMRMDLPPFPMPLLRRSDIPGMTIAEEE